MHLWWFCVIKNVFRISFDPLRVLFGVTEFRFVKIVFTTSMANVTSTKRNSVTPKRTRNGSKLIRKTFFTTQNHQKCAFWVCFVLVKYIVECTFALISSLRRRARRLSLLTIPVYKTNIYQIMKIDTIKKCLQHFLLNFYFICTTF